MTKTTGANIFEAEFLFLTVMDALSADAVYEDTFKKNQLDLMRIRFMRCSRLLGLARQEVPYLQGSLSGLDLVAVSQRMSELKTALDQSGTFVPADSRAAQADPDPDPDSESLRSWLVDFQRSYRQRFNAEHSNPVLKWVPKDPDNIQAMCNSFNDAIVALEKLIGNDVLSLTSEDAIELARAPSQASLMEAAKGTDFMLFDFLREEQMKQQQKQEVGNHEVRHDPEQHQEQLKREEEELQRKLAGIRSEQSVRNLDHSFARAELTRNLGANNQDYHQLVVGLQRDQAACDRQYRLQQTCLQRDQVTRDSAHRQQEERLQREQARRDQDHILQMTALQDAYKHQEANLQSRLVQRKSELQKEPYQRKSELYSMLLDADRLYTEKSIDLRAQYHQETQGLQEQHDLRTQEYFGELLELRGQHTEREDEQLKRQDILRQQEHCRQLADWQKKLALQQYELEQEVAKRDLDHAQWHTVKQREQEELEDQLRQIHEQMPPETRREMENRAKAFNNPTSIPIYTSIADMKARKAAAAATPSRAGTADTPGTPSTTSSSTVPWSPPRAPDAPSAPSAPRVPRRPVGRRGPIGPQGPITPTSSSASKSRTFLSSKVIASNITAANDPIVLSGNHQFRTVLRNVVIDDSSIVFIP
ncbi:unnamed protein product [Clonostachys chloroleuca]|uniref:Uncharacterized protein n=1 Tax=Clonostachys chloroleuca TaxID=1926264 RepID=A0AA35LPH3_9HYPO|nr:unnamed protein product [Clonostachys chloroleuca]